MKTIVILLFGLLLAAIAAFVGVRWHQETEARRVLACTEGSLEYSYINVEGAHVGNVDFITTPDKVYSEYGEPESILEGNWRTLPDLIYFESSGIRFKVWGDTLAIVEELIFDSGTPALVLRDKQFDGSTTLREIKGAYPASYQCRNVPFNPRGSSGGAVDTEIVLIDTLNYDIAPRGGMELRLLFKDGQLKFITT